MEPPDLLKIPRYALPWVLLFILIFLLLVMLGFLGYDNWSDLREVT